MHSLPTAMWKQRPERAMADSLVDGRERWILDILMEALR